MNNEAYCFALKNTLNEIQNVCPDVSGVFIFKDKKTLATDETTTKKAINSTINAFEDLRKRTNMLGDLEAITVQSTNGQVHISCLDDFCLATILEKEADEKFIDTVTKVVLSTVNRLLEKIEFVAEEKVLPATVELESIEDSVVDEDSAIEQVIEEPEELDNDLNLEETEESVQHEDEETPENDFVLLPEPPVTQLMVEKLGGLLVPSDTVRIDNSIIARWIELYNEKEIVEVELESLNGETTRCKFKNIKDSKHKGKGVVRVPEKIQRTLGTSKGELVMIKPVVE